MIDSSEHDLAGEIRLPPGKPRSEFGTGLYTGFGRALASPGDLDGDGIEDLVAGAPSNCRTGHLHGALWVLLLGADGQPTRMVEVSVATGFPARFEDFGGLGTAVAPLGDLDEDGVPDLAVGAPGWRIDGVRRGGAWLEKKGRRGAVARGRGDAACRLERSERRACELVRQPRATQRYAKRRLETPVITGATQPPAGACLAPVTIVALLPLQRDALAAELLDHGTGHLPLAVELELDGAVWPGDPEASL